MQMTRYIVLATALELKAWSIYIKLKRECIHIEAFVLMT